MLDLLFTSTPASSSPSTLVRSAWEQLRAFGVVPRSRYTTSWEGLTFRQAIHMPLPPYLSPLPVIFRMLAYAVITPFVFLLFLDVGGYIVWRIYEGVSLTGTRTAFYKFRTSPVFTRSRNGSPVISKNASKPLGPSPPRSPETRETSISPISSSASLQDETYGMNSDGELEIVHSSSSSSSPGGYNHPLHSSIDKNESNRHRSSAVSALETSNLDNSIRRRAIHRNSASGGKRFSMGSEDGDNDDSRREEREQTPTSTSLTSNPPHLTRSNSLGLGFSTSSSTDSANMNRTAAGQNNPTMYIASSNTSRVTSGDDLVKIEKSPAGSTASSSYLEDDDAIFDEAKEIR